MKEQKIVSAKALGLGMYLDTRNREFYYDNFTKRAYLMDEDEKKRNYVFAFRKPASLIIPYLINSYTGLHWIWTILMAVVLYFGLEYVYHKTFLEKLVSSSNVTISDKKNFLQNLSSLETPKLILSVIVGITLAVVTFINARDRGFTGVTLYFNYAFCLVVVAISLYLLYQLIVRLVKKP